jgi:undecaprenyl-diphosphatase
MENAFDIFPRVILYFSQEIVIIPFIIIGYIWLSRINFFYAIIIVFVSIIFNSFLKISFKIPLPVALGKEGFAFPSGHTQTSVALYGWLMINIKNKIYKIFLCTLMAGISLSLVYLTKKINSFPLNYSQ